MGDPRDCRPNCGACCIVPAIMRPFHGMPQGKPAGVPCIHLTDSLRCGIFDDPRRPACCAQFRPQPEVCGDNREQALRLLSELDAASQPEI